MTLGKRILLRGVYSDFHGYANAHALADLNLRRLLCGPNQKLPKCVSALKLPCTFAIVNFQLTLHKKREPRSRFCFLLHLLTVVTGKSLGSNTQILPRCFIAPAFLPASAPAPQKKSARTPPLMAPPVSWAIISRFNGLLLLG